MFVIELDIITINNPSQSISNNFNHKNPSWFLVNFHKNAGAQPLLARSAKTRFEVNQNDKFQFVETRQIFLNFWLYDQEEFSLNDGLTEAKSPTGWAYIVENEMVFTQLCDRAAQFSSPLICTSGQPSVAALRLLDLLAASGTALFYSGDFDEKGLSIAAQLCTRYPDLLKPWHMVAEDYDRCRSDISLSSASQSLLQGCAGTVLEMTAQLVEQHSLLGFYSMLSSCFIICGQENRQVSICRNLSIFAYCVDKKDAHL